MNKKYFIFYFLTIAVFALLVIAKQKAITKKNEKEIVSFYSSWKTQGKPVVVRKVKKSDMNTSLKMTLTFESENTYVGYLPKRLIKTIALESPVFIHLNDQKIPCKFLEIGSGLDLESGMYPIKILCMEKLPQENKKYLAEVSISGLKNVMILPHDSISLENDKSFVWVVKEGKAHKQFVNLEERNYKGVVANGIDEKDLIIVGGAASIEENDPVNFNLEN